MLIKVRDAMSVGTKSGAFRDMKTVVHFANPDVGSENALTVQTDADEDRALWYAQFGEHVPPATNLEQEIMGGLGQPVGTPASEQTDAGVGEYGEGTMDILFQFVVSDNDTALGSGTAGLESQQVDLMGHYWPERETLWTRFYSQVDTENNRVVYKYTELE